MEPKEWYQLAWFYSHNATALFKSSFSILRVSVNNALVILASLHQQLPRISELRYLRLKDHENPKNTDKMFRNMIEFLLRGLEVGIISCCIPQGKKESCMMHHAWVSSCWATLGGDRTSSKWMCCGGKWYCERIWCLRWLKMIAVVGSVFLLLLSSVSDS